MSEQSHESNCATRGVVEAMDCDDSSGYVECACGWRSRSMKTNWLRERAAEHLGISVSEFRARERENHPSVRWGGK